MHAWTEQGCKNTKNSQESKKSEVRKDNFLGHFFAKMPYGDFLSGG